MNKKQNRTRRPCQICPPEQHLCVHQAELGVYVASISNQAQVFDAWILDRHPRLSILLRIVLFRSLPVPGPLLVQCIPTGMQSQLFQSVPLPRSRPQFRRRVKTMAATLDCKRRHRRCLDAPGIQWRRLCFECPPKTRSVTVAMVLSSLHHQRRHVKIPAMQA